MKGQILTHRSGIRTARKLSHYLNIPIKLTYIYSNLDYLIRYGNSNNILKEPSIVINNSSSIKKSSNKILTNKILKENKILCPNIYSSIYEIECYPVLARRNYHSRGRDFYILESETGVQNVLDNGYYIQEFISNIKHEYRIFIWNGQVFEYNIKQPCREDYSRTIRNHDNGWRFYQMLSNRPDIKIIDNSIEAVKLLGLDFGAVDICKTLDGKVYIFEVNSAPSLIDRKLIRLAELIQEKVENEYKKRLDRTPEICYTRNRANEWTYKATKDSYIFRR